jgi:hypothetical protein
MANGKPAIAHLEPAECYDNRIGGRVGGSINGDRPSRRRKRLDARCIVRDERIRRGGVNACVVRGCIHSCVEAIGVEPGVVERAVGAGIHIRLRVDIRVDPGRTIRRGGHPALERAAQDQYREGGDPHDPRASACGPRCHRHEIYVGRGSGVNAAPGGSTRSGPGLGAAPRATQAIVLGSGCRDLFPRGFLEANGSPWLAVGPTGDYRA